MMGIGSLLNLQLIPQIVSASRYGLQNKHWIVPKSQFHSSCRANAGTHVELAEPRNFLVTFG